MTKDLTTSAVDRQNILNNPEVVQNIQEHLGLTGMLYENEFRFTTSQLADFFGVSTKTIKRQLDNFSDELSSNGYTVLKGKKLKEFKALFGHLIYADIDEDLEKENNKNTEVSDRDIDVPIRGQSTEYKLFKVN
jgi:transcriptional antiterminator